MNLQVRSENAEVLTFYRQLGYAVDDVLSLGKRIVDDSGNSEISDANVTLT